MIKYKISDELRKTFEFDMLAGVICYVISLLCKFVILVHVGLLNMTCVLESNVIEPEFFFIDEDNNNERHGG